MFFLDLVEKDSLKFQLFFLDFDTLGGNSSGGKTTHFG
jgi:hypothetical protein